MIHRFFLSSNPHRRKLAGVVAVAAAATAISSSSDRRRLDPTYSRNPRELQTADSSFFPSVSLSVSAPLRYFLSQFWNPNPAGLLLSPLNFSATSPISPLDLRKEANGDKGEDAKCNCGCLGRDSIAKAAAVAGPAVVNISVTRGINGFMLEKGMGSGTIIDPDGTILTCAHVVVDFEGARTATKGKVEVTLQDGREYVGTVVNADLLSDIAIVKINSKTPLPSVNIGSSSKLRPGDWVVAVGCPLTLQNTVTAGIVSSVDRKSSDLGLGGLRREYLQTDCAINVGNSGGPLVNLDGEIVGVNTMKILIADGLSFAVPIDSVVKIIDHFKKNGRVVRPWLGLKMLDLNDMIIAQLKERNALFPDVSRGVLVPMVTPGSPADRAGFLPGDVVIEFDGKPVRSVKEITNILGDKVGVPLKVVVKRENNKIAALTVVPEEASPAL